MEPTFLLSDIPDGLGQQIISSVASSTCAVIAFIKDFEKLVHLQQNFSKVTCIVLDTSKNSDSLARFLKNIPLPNYILNFTGPDFSQSTLNAFQSCGVTYKERERGHSEVNFEGIVDDDDGYECRIIVNVVEKRSKLKPVSKKVRKFVRGATKKIANLGQDDEDPEEENVPLLNHHDSNEEPGFLASVLFFCCPCIFKAPEPEYCFRNRQDLYVQIHLEQLAEVQKVFKKIHAESNYKWSVSLGELERKKLQKMEELVTRVDEFKENEEAQLSDLKDQQNENTRDRLSNVLSAETIRKLEESRSRQTKGTTKYNADRAYRDGETLITKQVAIDRAQLKERHYCKLVEQQLQKLSEIQLKYQRKTRTLLDRYFDNRA